jgi:uncharacterized protein (TIGR02284 family)
METYRENFVPQLQRLFSILNDGKEGYRKAAQETHSGELRQLFLQFSESRQRLADELGRRIIEAGGTPDHPSGGILGDLHRHWMLLKTALTASDDQVILETCRNGDLAALDAYDDILQGAILETSLKPFLMNQRIDVHQQFLEVDKLYFSLFKGKARQV